LRILQTLALCQHSTLNKQWYSCWHGECVVNISAVTVAT